MTGVRPDTHLEPSPVHSYAAAGVDIDAGERAVDLMRSAIEASQGPTVVSRYGSFGAAVRSPGAGQLLVSSTDGVGTKICLVETLDEASGIGRDLVHHSINDILTCGASPLFFLDYLAFARLQPERAAAIVTGMANACATHGCALVGGETAELPDVYRDGAFDVAGCIVGTVPEESFLDGSAIQAGDTVIGLRSSGLHTNGYSLARRLLASHMDEQCGELTVRQALLEEHRCYLPVLRPLLESGMLKGAAHITGGGLPGNVPRMLPPGCAVQIYPESWPSLPIFERLGMFGIAQEEMYRTFNLGIGMVLVCDRADEGAVLATLGEGYVIGQVVPRDGDVRVLGL